MTELPPQGRGQLEEQRQAAQCPQEGPSGDDPTEEMFHLSLKAQEEGRSSSEGTPCKKIEVFTNLFNISLPPEVRIFKYDVIFTPEIDIHTKYAIISTMYFIRGAGRSFDGKTLYLCRCLQNEVRATRTSGAMIIKIVIKKVEEITTHSTDFLQILDILLKKVLIKIGLKLIHNHHFNPSKAEKINNNLEEMPGVATSILRCQAGNFLRVDLVHAINSNGTVLDSLNNLSSAKGNEDMQNFHAAAIGKFVGTIVWTRYNNKKYIIVNINWESTPRSTFTKSGGQLSYIDYFKQRWGYEQLNEDQPLLVVKPTEQRRRMLYLLPELSTLTDDWETIRSEKITSVDPDLRLKGLKDFLKAININTRVKDLLSPWQINFDCKPLRVQARQLPPVLKMKGQIVKDLMVVGIHSQANKGQLVGALVASLDDEFTQYYSATGITSLLEVALKKYREVNQNLPQTIVLCRVSHGQLEFKSEQVMAAFSAVGGDSYKPRWAYVIAQTSNTHFFTLTGRNPMPGTIVDSHITKPDVHDFFLVSQTVTGETVSPTRYSVMYNSTKLSVDHMQSLTYKLTRLYFSWQDTKHVPAP